MSGPNSDCDRLSGYVKLNVGGSLFYTTLATLMRGNSMLSAMFSGRLEVKTDDEGWVLIDRSGKHFGTILNYLRDGSAALPDSRQDLEELLAEARFFCIEGLRNSCEETLTRLPSIDDAFPRASIVIVKYPKAARALLASTTKPVVKLTMNRYNNVFSYTNNSHDNLLRNIECLEKYALMFADTVLFVKDVRDKSEQNEICNWSYYCRSHKLKSIDCIAIHYSSEKRLIKVEFPESRIHEEMLFLLSVATRQPSDAELIEIATQKGTTNSNSPFFALSGLGSGGGMPSTTGNGTDIVSGSGGGPGRLFGGSGRTGVSAASGGIVNNANNGPVSSIVGISSSPTGGCAGPEASSGSQTVSSSATGIDREDRDDVSPANAVLNVPLSQLMVAAAAAAAAGLSQDAYASALSQPASHHHQQQQSQHHHQALIPTPGNSVAAVGLTASPAGCNSLSGLMRLCRR